MENESAKPANSPKKAGIGCFSIGLILIFASVSFLILRFTFSVSSNAFIVIPAVLAPIALLGLAAGIGMYLKGREIDRLLSGEGLIASWSFPDDEKTNRKAGYVYIGIKGLYRDGVYLNWNRGFQLEKVTFEDGDPAYITFQHVRGRKRATGVDYSYGGPLRHRTKIVVPPHNREDALRVVERYTTFLQNQ